MEKYMHYFGEFISRAGTLWRAEIWEDSETMFTPEELTFEADEAITIDYAETKKEDVLCGSSATLRIESPGDRTYIGLYAVRPGAIRLDIYRDGALYWSGCLDPEFYEEPYERARYYTVSLTFSDFGVLDRKKYTFEGMQTLMAIVGHCLGEAAINYTGIDNSLITTRVTASTQGDLLNELSVDSANFYDEDGKASTLKEVLEGILQPLGLRMVQRGGRVYVYDLNGLYTLAESEAVRWAGDSSTLGVDSVYNNVRITWSPYVRSGDLNKEDVWTMDTPTSDFPADYTRALTERNGVSYLSICADTNLATWASRSIRGFVFATCAEGKTLTLTMPKPPIPRNILNSYHSSAGTMQKG